MDQVVGLLGGGQLGRMFIEAASRLNVKTIVLDVGETAPAKQISNHSDHLDGAFTDAQKIAQLAERVDVLTVEIEHVDVDALEQAAKSSKGRKGKGVRVYPAPEVIRTIQDKFVQHEHLRNRGVAVADFVKVDGEDLVQAASQAGDLLGYPFLLKARTLAYDGRGNYVVRTREDVKKAVETLGNGKRALYAERFAKFDREAAVMVVRTVNGQTRMYPAVETVHRENVCHIVSAPLRSSSSGLSTRAQALAQQAIDALGDGAVGIFGVEMFVMPDGQLLVNEIAPRPHNSGHYTIEACATSQFENHLRAILDLPIGDPSLKVGSTIMLNLLGDVDIPTVSLASLKVDGATLHLYGKAESRAGRKMGHITIVGDSDAQARRRMHELLQSLPAAFRDTTPFEAGVPAGFSHPAPLVSIIMGSDSDLPTMLPGARILDQFSVPYELEVVSAHRTPSLMVDFATSAAERGVRVIIAGAGGAAHLPGMVAALTSLPVIGVPVKGSSLDGVDSLHSIVQMPVRSIGVYRSRTQRGIPVATVAIGNGTNAGLLAVRILGSSISRYRLALDDYARDLAAQVDGKRKRMAESGWEKYKP